MQREPLQGFSFFAKLLLSFGGTMETQENGEVELKKRYFSGVKRTANVDFCVKYTIVDFSTFCGACLKSFPHPVENFVEISVLQGKTAKIGVETC